MTDQLPSISKAFNRKLNAAAKAGERKAIERENARTEFLIAREREADPHYSLEDRADYFQLLRMHRGHIFIREAADRALKRIREHTS